MCLVQKRKRRNGKKEKEEEVTSSCTWRKSQPYIPSPGNQRLLLPTSMRDSLDMFSSKEKEKGRGKKKRRKSPAPVAAGRANHTSCHPDTSEHPVHWKPAGLWRRLSAPTIGVLGNARGTLEPSPEVRLDPFLMGTVKILPHKGPSVAGKWACVARKALPCCSLGQRS